VSSDFSPGTRYLDLPSVAGRRELKRLLRASTALFEGTLGTSETLESDLQKSSKYFDPVAQGQRLRRELTEVPVVEFDRSVVPASWLFYLPEDRTLLGPEGIAGMHAVRMALSAGDSEAVHLDESLDTAVEALLLQYKRWSRHRLTGVVKLLEGDEKPLQIQAIGTLLALLINNNVGSSSGVGRYNEREVEKRDAIDTAFFEPVRAFTKVLAPESKVKSGGSKLISGWTMYEIARRFGPGFHVEPGRENRPGSVYIEPDRVSHAIALIARDLNRGHRRRTNLAELATAFDRLVEVFRENRGTLAGFGELNESADRTALVRQQLLSAFAESASADGA